MKIMTRAFAFGGAIASLLLLSANLQAAPTSITCPDGDSILVPGGISIDRTATLENVTYTGGVTSLTCGPAGVTSGGSGGMPEGNYFTEENGYTFLEKINAQPGVPIDFGTFILEITGLNGTSGSFTLVSGLSDATVVLKFGGGGTTPDWISFNFDGMTSADWSVTQGQALSHITLYGTFTQVPEPTTLALLGLGLMGLGYRARRRQVT